jgi:hypothetical protein
MAKSNPHTGSRFDDFLKEEGIYDEAWSRPSPRRSAAWGCAKRLIPLYAPNDSLRNPKQLGTTKPVKPFTTPSNGEDNGLPW